MSDGVLHFEFLTPLFLKTIFIWAESTSTSLIPLPAILPTFGRRMQCHNFTVQWRGFNQQSPRGTPTLGPLFPWKHGTAHKFGHLAMMNRLMHPMFRQHWRNKQQNRGLRDRGWRSLQCNKLRDLNTDAEYLFLRRKVLPLYLWFQVPQ